MKKHKPRIPSPKLTTLPTMLLSNDPFNCMDNRWEQETNYAGITTPDGARWIFQISKAGELEINAVNHKTGACRLHVMPRSSNTLSMGLK